MTESTGRLRIALALEYPLLQHGGTEVLVRELLQGLAKRFEIVLVSGDRDRRAWGDHFGPLISDHFFWDNATPSRTAARKLAKALVESGVRLAHFHSGDIYLWQSHKAWQSPLYYLTGAGVPCLVTSHLLHSFLNGFTRPDRPAWQKALLLPKAWLSKALLLQRIKTEILVSKQDQAQMRHFYPMFATKIEQIYHSRLHADSDVSLSSRKKIIFCLGTFCQRKGQAVLTRAFASIAKRHSDWTLHMMGPPGGGGYLEKVKEMVDRLGISSQVQFIPAGDPKTLLATAAIFAMPSFLEGLPLSLQEALYNGCACVGSDVCGIPELIEHEKTGLLVPAGDEQALAAALDRLMTDSELRLRLAQYGRASIIEKGMLAEVMVEKHIRLYEAILENERALEKRS